ncbi:MAG: hypothetical protein LDLANPLL_01140 [Turneriella sp.]|nr:hypothetical protein [Turneriella sp.]
MSNSFSSPRRGVNAILAARALRISSVAHAMKANYETAYRRITRFLNEFNDHDMVLQRMLCGNVPFLIADPTIIDRPEAEKTKYVGLVRPPRRGFKNYGLAKDCPTLPPRVSNLLALKTPHEAPYKKASFFGPAL